MLAALHCITGTNSEELSIGRYANRNVGKVSGIIPLKHTNYDDTAMDWVILERRDEFCFTTFLTLCDFKNLPRVDEYLWTCYAPCGLTDSSIIDITIGDYCRITQYAPENAAQLHDDFEVDSSSCIDSPREDPLAIYVSVDKGLFGGCCGAPYIDRENRVVAFHLYSGDDSIPIEKVVKIAMERASKKQKTTEEREQESSHSGFASIKQGIVISKVTSLVDAIRVLLAIDLNPAIGTGQGKGWGK